MVRASFARTIAGFQYLSTGLVRAARIRRLETKYGKLQTRDEENCFSIINTAVLSIFCRIWQFENQYAWHQCR